MLLRSKVRMSTIQLKNISQHKRMFGCKDDGNCVHQGWTKMFSVCFTLKDSTGDIWSVKMIANSRSKAGESEDHWFKLNEIFTGIQLQMELADSDYKKLM